MADKKPRVILAEVLGFCSGVRFTLDKVYSHLSNHPGETLSTYGDIVHNRHVVAQLSDLGVHAVQETETLNNGTIIIRTHGAEPSVFADLGKKGLRVIDGTCPTVKKSHHIVESYSERGYHIVVVGQPDHSEVRGICARAQSSSVVQTTEEAQQIEVDMPILAIAQTTCGEAQYQSICATLKERFPQIKCINTVCNATIQRIRALNNLLDVVDAVVVVGGRESANTGHLKVVAEQSGKPTWHVECAAELPREIQDYEVIGLTAGASTPDDIINEIKRTIENDGN